MPMEMGPPSKHAGLSLAPLTSQAGVATAVHASEK